MRTVHTIVAILLCLTFSGVASAQETWTFTRIGGSVDAATTSTFAQLLKTELSSVTGTSFKTADVVCEDPACAQKAGADQGSVVAVFGSLGTLGNKIVAAVTLVDVDSGTIINTQRMSVDRPEDLDSVAERMAAAFARGTGTDETAALGNITAEEAKPKRRR
jgi:hypothetical protein